MAKSYSLNLYLYDLSVLRNLENHDLEGLERIKRVDGNYPPGNLENAIRHYDTFLEIFEIHPFRNKAIASPELPSIRDHSGKTRLYNFTISCAERAKRMVTPLEKIKRETDNKFRRRLEHTILQQDELLKQGKFYPQEDLSEISNAYALNRKNLKALDNRDAGVDTTSPKSFEHYAEKCDGPNKSSIPSKGVQGVLFRGLNPRLIAHKEAIMGGGYEARKYRERVGKIRLEQGLY